jgi:hypothetical protein
VEEAALPPFSFAANARYQFPLRYADRADILFIKFQSLQFLETGRCAVFVWRWLE